MPHFIIRLVLNIEIVDTRVDSAFDLFPVLGQRVLHQSNIQSDESFIVRHLNSGIYFWSISHHGKFLESGKVFIQRE